MEGVARNIAVSAVSWGIGGIVFNLSSLSSLSILSILPIYSI